MRLHQKIVVVCLTMLLGVGQAFAAAGALKILSAAPKGQQGEMGRQAVNVHFNQPVVALGEESQFSSQNCPLTITPSVPGSCHFSGTQTLVFEPTENWPAATQFTVTVPKGFTSAVSGQKLAATYAFSFKTQVPQVLSVLPYKDEHWINLTPVLFVQTSMPIDVNRAGKFVKLSSKDHVVSVAVRMATDAELEKNFSYLSAQEKKNVLAISPIEKLQVGQKYTLSLLAGLPAKKGILGMDRAYETSFFTYPNLTVQKVISTGCLPFTPSIQLSTPVRKREVWNHLQVKPESAKQLLNDRELDSVGNSFTNPKTGEAYFSMPLSFITVNPHESLQVTLTKGMRDIYGNTLAQDRTFTITNNGYCPSVDFSADGVGVLESYLPARLPVDLMNISSLQVQAARFNKNNFIPFYEQDSSYCAKKPLAQTTFSGEYTFKDVKDKTYKTYLDLARFEPTATDSIIFSQLKTTRKDDKSDCWLSSTDNITDVGVTFKTSAQNILIWTTSLQTAKPLAGMQVELRGKDNKVVWTGTTDANGLVLAPGWEKLEVPTTQWGQPSLYAFITSPGGNAVVSNLWNDGTEPWRFNIDYEYNPAAYQLRSYLFTDRGIYRPGEKVHVKGVVRQMQDGVWHLPSLVRGELKLTDARGEEISKKEVTLSSLWGTFDTVFELGQNASTGYWEVAFTPLEKAKNVDSSYASFQVESVKPADFNVDIRANMPQYLAGEEATFTAAAQYYFGAPLAGAKAQWTLHRENAWFTPKGYEKYTFVPYFLQQDRNEEDKLLLNASGTLDSRGALMFAAKMPMIQLPTRVYAEVNIQSPARQNLFKRTSVLVHPADVYVGAKLAQDSYEQGQPVEVNLVAVTPEGKPTETTATAQIYREEYFSVRKVGLAGRLEWVSEKKITPLPSQEVQISKKGGVLRFTPPQAGSYYVKLTAQDLFGRTVQGGIDVYVYGEGHSAGQMKNDDLLKLTQNKNEYKVGQKARIRVESPYPTAQALVTVEREGILDAWTTVLKGSQTYVDVPIKSNYLPNVYVSVILVNGRTAKPADEKQDLGKPQGKIGYVNLNVIPDSKRLDTTLKTNASSYQPGQRVHIDLATKANGKGVPAEVVVMAVDEGILALSNYKTPDLFDYFYGSKPLSVFTMDNRAYVIGQRNFGEKGENRGGGGGAQSKLGGTDLRSRFEFTPYFAAAVQTDQKGKAHVSFELPDNLTTFRIMAVALTETEFGQAQRSVKVSKPVMVTPSLPRFAREGDQFKCGVIVYNYEDSKGAFEVLANAMGSVQLEGVTQQLLTIPQGQSREVLWNCRATKTGEALLTFMAKGRYTDGVESRLQVSTTQREQQMSLYGSTSYTHEEKITQPENLNLTAPNRVTVSIASTALLHVKGALSYLLEYPYNCLEQQISKIIPFVKAGQLLRDFKLADQTALRKQAQEVMTQLPSYQHALGGYGYWPGSLPDPYLTAYALDVALDAKQLGLAVPSQSIEKAVTWLEGAFGSQTMQAHAYSTAEMQTAQAYAAYVLARYGKNVDSSFNTLYSQRVHLKQEAIAYLLQAATVTKRDPAVKQALGQQLINRLVYTSSFAYVDEPVELPWIHGTNITATAHTLQALLMAGFRPEEASQMVAWLITQLNKQGHWGNTQANAAAVQALQVYYQLYESQTPDFTAAVSQAYNTRLEGSFQGRSVEEKSVSLPFSQVYAADSMARFSFTKQGTGTLYYSLGQIYTPASYPTPVQAGFSIMRSFSTLDGKPVSEVLVGERYKITLHIKTSAARTFVVAEDFIPAGFSIVNTSLATESSGQAQLIESDNTFFSRVEQYDDRIYGFADELPAGEHTFSYLVTAISAGTYTYPSAWVSQMYDPSVFGHNATAFLVIK